MANTPQPPLMIRASISADEWQAIRQRALTDRRPVQDLVADALRTAYLPTRQAEARS